ncbi:hypothetical protein, partial [Anaplasma phagocytophilum]|uniref:hypothetical protein n=1 Tax=Anaplasma phagocytophilum TaxID=948 RepID=UPI00201A3B77
VAFTSSDSEELKCQGKSIILVRQETGHEDIRGMISSAWVLTPCGGMTSQSIAETTISHILTQYENTKG